MDVDLGLKNIELVSDGVQLYIMSSKHIFSNNSFILKKENGELVTFNGHSIPFRLSIREV